MWHLSRWSNGLVGLFVVMLGGAACDSETEQQQPDAGTGGQAPSDCYQCHGDEANGNSAPPPAQWHETDVPDPHQSHLQGSNWHTWVECEDCHLVPTALRDPGHIDTGLPAEITWSGLAVADDADPSYDADAHTCQDVYCHGATLTGGVVVTAPDWSVLDGSQAECGAACHQNPPPLPHAASDLCSSCHSAVVDDASQIKAPSLHIDGRVSVDDVQCNLCHGGGTDPNLPLNWAPPQDTAGNTETTAVGVGAHREHLNPSSSHVDILCEECHVVPTSVMDPGHLGSPLPAELTWGTLATTGGATPTFTGSTCTDTYCHDANPLDNGPGRIPAPAWTTVDGSASACNACHGYPPATATHGPTADCGSPACHDMVVGADHVTFTAPDRHIDGVIDF